MSSRFGELRWGEVVAVIGSIETLVEERRDTAQEELECKGFDEG